MEINLIKFTIFHPYIDGQIEGFNIMIFSILWMYNSKHQHTWDEIIPYIQHSYNKSLYDSIDDKKFHTCIGFQPLVPIDIALPIKYTWGESSHA